MNAVSSQFNDKHRTGRRRAFSMTELLVVIAIIAVLAGILLVALKGVRERALATQTRATMQEFSKACDSFQIEHGHYPGVIPESVLAAFPEISGTENALLHMMGGYRVFHPQLAPDPNGEYAAFDGVEISFGPDWKLKVDVLRIGEGPVINGRPYAPYFTPKGDELRVASGQMQLSGDLEDCSGLSPNGWCLPDLLDAWGQPIIYEHRLRTVGPLAPDADQPDVPSQFLLETMNPYINSGDLGDLGGNQQHPVKGSILELAANDDEKSAIFAQIIRHPSFGLLEESLTGTARGAYVLISPGKDGLYFSATDGPGTPQSPIFGNGPNSLTFAQFMLLGPKVIDEFDDLRLFGGG